MLAEDAMKAALLHYNNKKGEAKEKAKAAAE
jgi:hypothetical protein